jgi:hypothetical protein
MNAPGVRRVGDEFYYEWPESGLGLTLSRIRDHRGDLSGEIHVQSVNGKVDHVHRARLSLLSTQSRQGLVRFLQTRGTEEINWQDVIEQACEITIRKWREGAPIERLADIPDPPPHRDLIRGYLPAGETSVSFADGGSLKSTIAACVVGVAVASGHAVVPGLDPQITGPVLYLDWESSGTEHKARVSATCRQLGIPIPRDLLYQRQFKPLVDQDLWLRETVAELDVKVLFLDSLVPAVGGEPKDAAPIAALFNTLRSLGAGVTSHVIAHMSKAEAGREQGRARAYGSVFVENLARSVWELRVSEANSYEGSVTVGLYHRKANVGALKKPFGLEVAFDETGSPAAFTRVDVRDVADLADRLPLTQRIREALKSGRRSTAELVTMLNATDGAIRKAASRMDDVRGMGGSQGRGNASVWELRAWDER